MKIQGIITKIYPTQQVTNTFKKREFVIETQEKYPQLILFQVTQNKCEDLDSHKAGALVDVHFNLRGREYTPKGKEQPSYFNTIEAWKIVSLHQKQANETISKNQEASTIDSDSLPF